jgi:uncharacterized protein YhbP (UPF0306 family)
MSTAPNLSFDQEIAVFLATSRTAGLATTDSEGCPHACNVQFVSDEAMRLYWVSSPSSAHSVNLTIRPECAITIYAHDDRAEVIHGMQLHGTVESVEPGEPIWNDIFDRYTEKFAFVRSNPQLKAAVENQSFYCFTPSWLRWIDNRVRFGFKVEKSFEE